MKRGFKSLNDIYNDNNELTPEQYLLNAVFSNLATELVNFLNERSPLCQFTWITSQQLINIASSKSYHRSYLTILKFLDKHHMTDQHSNKCTCMKFDLNLFNRFGITPFLNSLPCTYDILTLQVKMGADLNISPRCSLLVVISPLYAYMKHLVNQVYDQATDDVDVASCLAFLCQFKPDLNYVPPNVCYNLMMIFSIAANILVQEDRLLTSNLPNQSVKATFLEYVDKILSILLGAGLDPSRRCHVNKLSYEVHGDGLFDFIFMLKWPRDEISIDYVSRWITRLIQHGCDPESELRSKCRDLLRFKSLPNKPNVALSIFLYVLHELFDDNLAHCSSLERIHYVLGCLTSPQLTNRTSLYFRVAYPHSIFARFSVPDKPKSLKFLARFVVCRQVLHNRLVSIDQYDLPLSLIDYVKHLQ